MPRFMISMTLLAILLSALSVAHAQEGSICVLAYEDSNANGQRDTGEAPLPGIPVYITTTEGVILRSHISTSENTPHCFESLPPNTYDIRFTESANHRPTTEQAANIPLDGQRVSAQFGAQRVPVLPDTPAETRVQENTDSGLSTLNRLLLAGLGALIVVVLMLGLGAIIFSIIT